MAGFNSLKTLVETYSIDGKFKYTTWRKQPTQVTASGFWFDLSMSPGNPSPQYYASSPLVSKAMSQSVDGGIYHGPGISPLAMNLHKLTALSLTATVLPMILCDYLLYYPFVDEGIFGEEQLMTNSVTLPRYTDGEGVQMMAVVVGGQLGGQTFQVNYTNSAGVSGRTTRTVIMSTQAVNGTIVTTSPATAGSGGPFIPLQTGDTGVRSIEGVTMNGEDVGVFTLVLIKPLADISLRGIDAPVEVDYFIDRPSMPRVYDDAYLNFICHPVGSLNAAPIHGDATFVWS